MPGAFRKHSATLSVHGPTKGERRRTTRSVFGPSPSAASEDETPPRHLSSVMHHPELFLECLPSSVKRTEPGFFVSKALAALFDPNLSYTMGSDQNSSRAKEE